MKRTLLVFVALLAIMPLATCEPAPAGAVEPPSAEECATLRETLVSLPVAGFQYGYFRLQMAMKAEGMEEARVHALVDRSNAEDITNLMREEVNGLLSARITAVLTMFGCPLEAARGSAS